ncbi:MAG: hypothetical protein ACREJC_04785, partial [Tepidisphaeraceae bacterium]
MTQTADRVETAAERFANRNLKRNLAALSRAQPRLCDVISRDPALEWVFGRDRSLTAWTTGGLWWSGCSVPTRAARAMLRKLDATGAVSCFLAPPTAASVRVALEAIRLEQAIIAVVPDPADVSVMFCCEDFSGAIEANRLWVAHGDAWANELRGLLDAHSGLAIPTRFIRLPCTDPDAVSLMIDAAQKVFSEVTATRACSLEESRRKRTSRTGVELGLCVAAPRRFRLWSDWGQILSDSLAGFASRFVDADDPLATSPLAIAQAACECRALLTVDACRSDAPGILPDDLPWITWITSGRIPSVDAAAPLDQLLLVDPADVELARSRGWPESRLTVAQPPVRNCHATPGGHIAIIVDTFDLSPPADVEEYSSQRLLWEFVVAELRSDPFALDRNVDAYLNSRLAKFEIEPRAVDVAAMAARLVLPAWQRGLAHVLRESGMSLRIHGRGWDRIDAFAAIAPGEVCSREDLCGAIDAAGAILQITPGDRLTAVNFHGRLVLRAGTSRKAFLRDAE